MKWFVLVLFSVLSALGVGCATTQQPEGRHAFSFEFEGAQYHIIGVDLEGGDGANILLLRDTARVLLRALDLDQDGLIDTVLTGNTTLSKANEIYASGIAIAKSQGRYSVQTPARLFEFSRPEGTYTVQTSLLGDGSARNRFELQGVRAGNSFVALDGSANGILDKLQEGAIPLDDAQSAYVIVLNEGLRVGRIDQNNGQYIVSAHRRQLSREQSGAARANSDPLRRITAHYAPVPDRHHP